MNEQEIIKLKKMEERYEELTELLSRPEILLDRKLLSKYNRERKQLEEGVQLWREYKKSQEEMKKVEELLLDDQEEEIKELAREEKDQLKKKMEKIEEKISKFLVGEDEYSQRNIIVEIRAGAGGEEAALFVADLYKMYVRLAERKGWRMENIHFHPTDMGGFKEAIFALEGKDVFSNLRYESGVHRPRNRVKWKNSYLHCYGGCSSRGTRGRSGDKAGGPVNRDLPLSRSRRATCKCYRFSSKNNAPSHGNCSAMSG